MTNNLKESKKRTQIFLLARGKKCPSSFFSLRPRIVSSKKQLSESVRSATKDSLWVSYEEELTNDLMRLTSKSNIHLGNGLLIHPLDMNSIPVLTSLFDRLAFEANGGFLPPQELAEVFESENRSDLFIGGSVNSNTETITFWRGNLRSLTVPFDTFPKSGDGTELDFEKCTVIDSGLTVQLGDYEAAVEAILYEYDSEFRRRLSKKRLQDDQSFGASLRRLRKQRGLRREDFEPDICAKTIARIEQGKVSRIQKRTLGVLSSRLGVMPEEIESF